MSDLKIGDKVKMINCLEADEYKDKVWVVRSEPFEMCGSKVILLEGKRGGFDTDCLELVKDNMR